MSRPFLWTLLVASIAGVAPVDGAAAEPVDAAFAERFARLALDCVDREYPNKIAHVLQGDADVAPPRTLTPAFFGCYDWHSSVHGHWLLVRLARSVSDAELSELAMSAVGASLTEEKIAGEVRYLAGAGRVSFERPYGLAWLLQLAAELRSWDDERARALSSTLEPLELAAAARIKSWLPKLDHPIRTGEHAQTAFAFGLTLDWARTRGDRQMERLLLDKIAQFYLEDRDCPIEYEPSGQDFLSPCLAEADLVRRVLDAPAFAAWLGRFLPGIPHCRGGDSAAGAPGCAAGWLVPAVVSDPSDPKLAHLDGLNLSRAWMIRGIASGLPNGDPRRRPLERAAAFHREVGLRAVTGEHYEGGHWLGSFATYLVTDRGLVTEP